jgi:hypothetical protein
LKQIFIILIFPQQAEYVDQDHNWISGCIYKYNAREKCEIPGLEAGSSYAVRAILIDETRSGYFGTDVPYAVYNTTCVRKFKYLNILENEGKDSM